VYVEGRGPEATVTPDGEPVAGPVAGPGPVDLGETAHDPETRSGPPPNP
jgi:hypothetical protein